MDHSKFWQMRDGNLIEIEKMADSHLLNTIAMLERNVDEIKRSMILQMYNHSIMIHSDTVLDMLDNDIRGMQDTDGVEFLLFYHPSYPHLRTEAIKRGLMEDDIDGVLGEQEDQEPESYE